MTKLGREMHVLITDNEGKGGSISVNKWDGSNWLT